ncbi:UDP-glucuronosyltransferase 2B10 precursor [Mus musculus]|uniref:UDP-glucuronosyltransferase n=2 Tax=Mus musculus TaxID=10090 RepID=Q8K154_MOUSE|nr:UDP-glucuronosyltransferase 2B10 precursor [Mus musculus]AAH28826.1 UDP glucuronosyltransferase 2 family, polypeptide B34 [Mus musculus]EDL37970.1 UDP glucuronosyltransferase 2 family, polypeptide B34 [Mus musculus]|eukprot:NP_705826.1 UDP-glucuronosyltransferase 2B10 precursor [Mus musculus]
MPVKMTAALLLLLLQLSGFFGSGTGGKVLVWPMEFSHWLNLKTILDELLKKGHEVMVLRPSASLSYEVDNTSAIEFETYPTSYSLSELEEIFWESLKKYIYELPKQSFWGYFLMLQEMVWVDSKYFESLCKDVVFNKELMTKLQKSRFDVILADPFIPCGDLLAEVLKIPLVYSLRFFPGSTYEKYSGGLPLPPSYVPVVMSELSDRMTFMERVRNVIYMLCFDFWFQTFNEKNWNQLYTEVLGRPTTLSETMAKADIWLIRTYWDLEFPHPVLPNFDFIGGLHCRPAKPLPKEIEDFVQSSGEHGVVVFSLGSMVGSITEERANVIAAGLAQIPQKVLWRFEGKKPETLGSNTRLYKWIPQNDLLGHSKTRAFITHGGTNGIYEAIYHGIPVVGIPLFGDQYDNIVHLKAKGAAVRLDFLTMSSTDLHTALKTVTNDPSYKENAMRLSRIHHDQPVKPLDRAVFWIEFVMRHKGAKHLRVAAHDLSWVQYHSLDVLGFLLACVLTVMFILKKCCLFCCQKLTKAGRKKKGE